MHWESLGFQAVESYLIGCTHNKLSLGIRLQNPGEDISNKVDTLLQGPTSNKDKQFSLGVLLKTGPLLSLALEICPACLELLVNGWGIGGVCGFLAPFGSVLRRYMLDFGSEGSRES